MCLCDCNNFYTCLENELQLNLEEEKKHTTATVNYNNFIIMKKIGWKIENKTPELHISNAEKLSLHC